MPRDEISDALAKAETFSPSWPNPDFSVLAEDRRPAPPLPLSIFGGWQGWISDTAEGTSSPNDYCACALLAVASIVGEKSRLESDCQDAPATRK